ncbi:MFS transporter [Aeromicrobium panaciterrae]
MRPTFRALSVRNFRIYLAGSIVSNIGTWMQRVAQDWLVLVVTGSGTALGITAGLQFLPTLLMVPFAGSVADRFPKRVVLRCTQVAMAAPSAVLGLLAVTGNVEAWHIYVIAFVFGTATAFDAPARQSFVMELVDRDLAANAVGLGSASFNTARLIGPAVAGVAIGALGSGAEAAGWVILANAVSYVAVFVSLNRLDRELLMPVVVTHQAHGIADGWRYVRTRRDLILLLMCVASVGTFGLNFEMMSALMTTETFGLGAQEFGALGSYIAVGSIVGALVAAHRGRPSVRIVVLSGISVGLVEIAAGVMPSYVAYAAIMPVLGFATLTMITTANALIQLTTTPSMRGRVAAIYMMLFMGGTTFGAPLIGHVGEAWGARWTLVAGGSLSAVGICAALIWAVLDARTISQAGQLPAAQGGSV